MNTEKEEENIKTIDKEKNIEKLYSFLDNCKEYSDNVEVIQKFKEGNFFIKNQIENFIDNLLLENKDKQNKIFRLSSKIMDLEELANECKDALFRQETHHKTLNNQTKADVLKDVLNSFENLLLALESCEHLKVEKDDLIEQIKKHDTFNLLKTIDIKTFIEKIKHSETTKVNLLIKGLNISIKQFNEQVLKKYNIQILNPIIGSEFNPDIHEAVSVSNFKEKKDGEILSVLKKGYLLDNILLRPSLVIVNKHND